MEKDQQEKINEKEKLPSREETIEELLAKISALEKEKEQYLENLKRAKGDVLRIQTEFEQKFQEMKEMAYSDLLYRLLSILDSFEIALEKTKDQNNDFIRGVYLIYAQLKDILEKYGLEEINPLNQKFDPHFHEAIATEKCKKENCQGEDESLIIEVLSKGYLYQGRLLRPARVKTITH